ncbi:hypothetical protein [Planctomycetes bacterium Poly30]
MTDTLTDKLDGCVRDRVLQLERVLSAVAHQLGATMLPSIKHDAELADHRSWKRLAFQTEALADHLRHQKLALDFLRGKKTGDLDDMPGDLWQEWVVPILQGLLTKGQRLVFDGYVSAPVSLPLSHAISTALIAVDEQMDGPGEIHLWLKRENGEQAIEMRIGSPMEEIALAAPSIVVNAWGGSASKLEVSPGSMRISGEPGREVSDQN